MVGGRQAAERSRRGPPPQYRFCCPESYRHFEAALAELRHMEHVEIWNNHLVGEVESIFANKPKLSFLWLNNDEQYAPGEWNNLEIKPGTKRFIHKKVPQCFIHL